jgi:chemotaxis response regulator CheB
VVLAPLNQPRVSGMIAAMGEVSGHDDSQVVGVVVVDDHPGFRAAIRALVSLDDRFEVIGEADAVRPSMELLRGFDRSSEPGLVLLDVNVGEIDGMTGAAMIAEEYPDVPIVLCSTAPRSQLPEVPRLPHVRFVPKQLLDLDELWGWLHDGAAPEHLPPG